MRKYWECAIPTRLLILGAVFSFALSLPKITKIGFISESSEDQRLVQVFEAAITIVNRNNSILPNSSFSPVIRTIDKHDSVRATNEVCSIMGMEVVAIFGPQSPDTSTHVQSICDYLDVPHITTHWGFKAGSANAINLYPDIETMGLAYTDLVIYWKWRKFAILYEDDEGLIRLNGLLKNKIKSDYDVTARKLPANDTYRNTMDVLRQMDYMKFVIDCPTEKVFTFLKQAQQVGMMTDKHSYLLTTLDLRIVDLEDFQYVGAGIIAFQLVDVMDMSNTKLRKLNHELKKRGHQNFRMTTDAALVSDAVNVLANALHTLDRSNNINIKPLTCRTNLERFNQSDILTNYIRATHMSEITGLIMLEKNARLKFDLDIVEASPIGLKKIGNWTSDQKLKMFPMEIPKKYYRTDNTTIRNNHLNVTVIETPPYTMRKNVSKGLQGNDQFEGFCIDLLNELSKDLKFNYTVHLVRDASYGVRFKHENGVETWSGLIGEVMNGTADMAIGDITINSEREKAVDFTMPFMNLGISILYRRPEPQPPNLLSFLSPFSLNVWLYMAAAYMGVSLVLFVLARLSPTEWDNPFPCVQEPENLHNSFGLLNSMWFTIGSLMQQGSDIAPKAASTRMVAGMWWFFTLIMISSYTANLAAFLAFEKTESPFNNVEELAKQTRVKYGCVGSGSTLAFFRDSTVPIYKAMHDQMQSHLVGSNKAGVERVKEKDDYAFFLEKTGIDYYTERECETVEIGGLIDNKGYGIALRQESPYRTELSASILKLHESEVIENLKKKWWQRNGGGKCRAPKGASTASALSLQNVGGIFVVLIAGMILACIIAVIEFVWKLRSISRHERGSLGHEIFKELLFALQCKNTKMVPKKRSSEPENGVATPLSNYAFTEREMFT